MHVLDSNKNGRVLRVNLFLYDLVIATAASSQQLFFRLIDLCSKERGTARVRMI